MTDLRSKVAYLRGLAQGLELGDQSKEGRMIAEMLNVVGELTDNLTNLASEHEDLGVYVDVLDTDLQDLEEEIYGAEEQATDALTEYVVEAGEEVPGLGPTGEMAGAENLAAGYPCPTCGEQVRGEQDNLEDLRSGSEGSIALRLSCPGCGTHFHRTEPGTVTCIEPEDELTDLCYPKGE